MESQQSPLKEIVYVCCGNASEFFQYQKTHVEYECIMIVDGTTLRDRIFGNIAYVGTYRDRWNYTDINESIERETDRWKSLIAQQPDKKDNNNEEIEYGTGF